MNTFNAADPTVSRTWPRGASAGVIVLDPDSGLLACGERAPDASRPAVIADFVRQHFAARDLEGRACSSTAGPTREPIDPVRFRLQRCPERWATRWPRRPRRRGRVGDSHSRPHRLAAPAGVAISSVTTAEEMHAAVMEALPRHQIVSKAAAVAITRGRRADRKIKKEAAGRR